MHANVLELDPVTRRRILIVEDDADQAKLLERWLERLDDVEIIRAADGQRGAELAVSGRWDLIVSDIDLPGLNGLEVLRRAKEADPATAMLLVTAHHSLEFALQAIRNRADELILKPLRRDELVAKADKLLAGSPRKLRRTVVAIGAHPDDVEIGCGGLLAEHRDQRDRIVIVTLTGGEHGGVIDTRVRESQEAARLLGAELVFGGLRDTQVPEGRETISVIEKVLTAVEPDTVYTHTLRDRHQDHRNAYRATMVAARGVPNVFCYQAPSTTIEFQPTRFVDISEQIDEKLTAIGKYRTQVASRQYLTPSLVRSTAEYWGRFAGYRLVEPLEVVRSVEL